MVLSNNSLPPTYLFTNANKRKKMMIGRAKIDVQVTRSTISY